MNYACLRLLGHGIFEATEKAKSIWRVPGSLLTCSYACHPPPLRSECGQSSIAVDQWTTSRSARWLIALLHSPSTLLRYFVPCLFLLRLCLSFLPERCFACHSCMCFPNRVAYNAEPAVLLFIQAVKCVDVVSAAEISGQKYTATRSSLIAFHKNIRKRCGGRFMAKVTTLKIINTIFHVRNGVHDQMWKVPWHEFYGQNKIMQSWFMIWPFADNRRLHWLPNELHWMCHKRPQSSGPAIWHWIAWMR